MRALKICLWVAGIVCVLSIFGMVLPVSSLKSISKLYGIESFADSPQFIYAIRVGLGTYAAVGLFFVILALDPLKYGMMVPFSALAAVFIGVLCAIAGLLTKVAFWWFMGDFVSCLVFGILILVFWKQATKTAG